MLVFYLNIMLQQYLPFTVLKLNLSIANVFHCNMLQQYLPFMVLKQLSDIFFAPSLKLQQHLPFTVCASECRAAEKQGDDEVLTSQVPKQSEGKTKVIRQQRLLFTVY